MGQSIQQVIDKIRKEFAQDKRTTIFDISYYQVENKIVLKGEVSDKIFKENLIKEIKNQVSQELLDSIEELPSKKLGKKTYGLVNLSVCNIRSKPDHPAELVTQALMGTPVKVYKQDGGWYLIQTPDDYLGWVDDDGIKLKTADEMHGWIKNNKIIYTSFFGFVYSDQNFNQILADVVAGNVFEVISQTKSYFEVKLPDNRKGFIKIDEALDFNKWFKSLSFDANSIIEFGKKMIGFPYLWGGTSIKGIDCSGFIKTIHFMNGLILPRDANQQALVGEEVPFDNEFSQLKQGDLIYFGRKADDVRPERITHVAIYLGNKKFLHSSGRVRLDSFEKEDVDYNEYRLNTIVRIKRILDSRETVDKLKIINNKFYLEDFYR